ncbi:hypothetical protein LOCC1_G000981 [Lachnellula occidentalis]|uniref:Uncharacterized protein n=1 Tax=Lachnellula occidentalis TaxID=215460 RepID=A0A8H8S5X9_9HELO|nr:hypothetical protein LOCC1_G000981 [Lachnellula occidentalis]
MSSQGNSGSQGSSGSGSSGSSYTPYTVTGSGTNSQGNDYDNRSQPCGEAYHYSNTSKLDSSNIGRALLIPILDGSYYYSNGDNSTYYNSGNGSSTYTAPNGNVYKK